MIRRELALVLGARVTWLVAALSALLVGHGFVLALDIYSATSRSAAGQIVTQRGLDPLAGIVRPTLGGLYLAVALLLPVIAARGLAIEKERGGFAALALRAGGTARVIAAKLVAALVAGALVAAAPIVLLAAFALAGGHLDAPETIVALAGHVLDIAVVACAAVAAAAATRTFAQAAVIGIVVSLLSWAIDASDELPALGWMSSLSWASLGKRLHPFELGIVQLGSLAWLVVLAAAAAGLAFALAAIPRRRAVAAAIAVAALPLLWSLGHVQRGYDWSEQRRQSLPPAVVEALHAIPEPITLEVWLDRDDGLRWQLERDAFPKLVLARSDLEVATPLDAGDRVLARDADYGRIVIRVGTATRETRRATTTELATLIFETAGRPIPDFTEPSYDGYPFVAAGATRTILGALAYLVLPATFLVVGFYLTRRRT